MDAHAAWVFQTREIVKKLMQEHGLTASRVGQETGVGQVHLSAYLAGKAGLGPAKLERLLAYFGLELGVRPCSRGVEGLVWT